MNFWKIIFWKINLLFFENNFLKNVSTFMVTVINQFGTAVWKVVCLILKNATGLLMLPPPFRYKSFLGFNIIYKSLHFWTEREGGDIYKRKLVFAILLWKTHTKQTFSCGIFVEGCNIYINKKKQCFPGGCWGEFWQPGTAELKGWVILPPRYNVSVKWNVVSKSRKSVYLPSQNELGAHILRIRSTHGYYKTTKYEFLAPSELRDRVSWPKTRFAEASGGEWLRPLTLTYLGLLDEGYPDIYQD